MTIPCFTHLSMSLWYLFRCYTTPQYKPVFVIKGQRIKQQWHHSSHLSALVPEELASVLYDLFVRQQTVGLLLTQGEDLPQGDTKRPHVAGCGELTLVEKMEPFKILICNLQLKISYWFKKKNRKWSLCYLTHQQDALPGHPAYGEHRPALDAVVVAAVQVSAHPEISNFDGEASVQQAVPGRQVTMHKVQRRQVFHPWGDLHRHVEEVRQTGGMKEGGECCHGNRCKYYIIKRDISTWLKGCCWRVSACFRSLVAKGTYWGLRSPCIQLPCTTGQRTHTHTAAGWCWGRSDGTWSWFPSGNHS